MAKIKKNIVRKQIAKGFNSRAIRKLAYEEAIKTLNRAKNEALRDFSSHPVTKELRNGSDSSNLSNTLGGRGNLFSFIGFQDGSDPTRIVERAIQLSRINKTPSITEVGKNQGMYKISFNASIPSKQELEKVTPMPFENGRSWLTSIERGISGLSYYIYNKTKNISSSRSGRAIQSRHPYISGLRYKPTSYISPILNRLRKRLIKG
jgi:hypothetical protein